MVMRKVFWVSDRFELGGAAQQLFDRLLLGWTVDGRIQTPPGWQLTLAAGSTALPEVLAQRWTSMGVRLPSVLRDGLGDADVVVLVSPGVPDGAYEARVLDVLRHCADDATVMFHGAWGASEYLARTVRAMAQQKRLRLWTTHADAFLESLPQTEIFALGEAFREGLLLAPGGTPMARHDALGAWLPRIQQRPGGVLDVRRVRKWLGTGVWGSREEWPWDLFVSAISRSDNPLGDSDRESRVQDLVGLGLVPGMAKSIEVWQLEHADHFISTLVLQTGILKDICLAARTRTGRVISRQLFRPGPPQLKQYDRLATAMVRRIERTGNPGPDALGYEWTRLTAVLPSDAIRAGHWHVL